MAKTIITKPEANRHSRRQGVYSDTLRVNTRHYERLCEIASACGYTALAPLLGVILDEALPKIKLVQRPIFDITLDMSSTDETVQIKEATT